MRSPIFRFVCLLACVALALPLFALQRGSDPISGTWSGDWGPNANDRNTVNVTLKLDGKNVTGTVQSINYKRPDVMIQKGTFDPASGTIQLEADAQGRGGAIHYVIQGKVMNGAMSGSWDHGTVKGDFKLTKK
jgi:hypothetical protein